MPRVMGISDKHRIEDEREDARSEVLFGGDLTVFGQEPQTSGRSEERPDEHEIDARIRATDVTPVNDAGDRSALDEHVPQMQIPVHEHELAGRRRKRLGGGEDPLHRRDRRSPEFELA